MILKGGGSPANPLGMKAEALIAAIVANEVVAGYGHNLTITSICDGTHGENSYHYDGYAIDIRTRMLSSDETSRVAAEIKNRLGPFYDVVIENTHIHIEFDARRATRALEQERRNG